jgi:hypothetical protein
MPNDSKNKTGLLAYTKHVYSSLMTLTKLEIDRGQTVPGLADCYLSNQFLKKIHRILPEKLASKFLFQLQENGENYYLMKGKVYMDRILNLLRCSYKSLEIELEETTKPAAASKVKPVKQTSVNAAVVTNGYTSSSSSDDQAGLPLQSKPKRAWCRIQDGLEINFVWKPPSFFVSKLPNLALTCFESRMETFRANFI